MRPQPLDGRRSKRVIRRRKPGQGPAFPPWQLRQHALDYVPRTGKAVAMAGLMHESSTKKIYDIHSAFYDATFGRLVRRRIEIAISHMKLKETDRVLDLGIGTGVSLNFYPQFGRVVG